MAEGGIDLEVFGWLKSTPAADDNFKAALARANAATVRAAMEAIGDRPTNKAKVLEARLRQLEKPTLAEVYAKEQRRKAPLDPVSEAAMEVVEMERLQKESARNEQAGKEKRLAECHQVIGRIQATRMFVKFGNVSELMWIKGVKETQLYKDLPGLETWERFCNSLGYTAKHFDEQLKNLETFGAEFLETVSDLRVGYRELRRLRQLTHEGALQVEDGVLVIGDEEIPLDADHREDLQAALERVIDAKNALVQEKDANLRTKERLLQDKQKLIERQAKDLARYEGEAERKGLLPAEDAILQKLSNARVSVDGFFLQFDPDRNPLPEDATPRMKAALLETLRYFKRVADAAYDTAGDLYGDAEMDSPGWIQPNLREVEESPGAALMAARAKAKKA